MIVRIFNLFFCLALFLPNLCFGENYCSFEQICTEVTSQNELVEHLQLKSNDTNVTPSTLKQLSRRAESIFQDTRQSVLGLLIELQKTSPSAALENIIQRVKSVKLLDHEKEFSKSYSLLRNGCDLASAYFISSQNQISLCPQLLSFPEPTLFLVLAHEIAHSFDPCSITHHLIETSDLSLKLLNSSDTAKLTKKLLNEKVLLPGLSLKTYPFSQALRCLAGKSSVAVTAPSIQDIVERTQHGYTRTNLRHSLTMEALLDIEKTSYEKRASMIQKYHGNFQYCADFSGTNIAAEAFADWIAATIVNKKLTELEKTNTSTSNLRLFAVESMGMLLRHCPQIQTREQDAFHLSEKIRLEKIFLAHPTLAKHLNCQPSSETKLCK